MLQRRDPKRDFLGGGGLPSQPPDGHPISTDARAWQRLWREGDIIPEGRRFRYILLATSRTGTMQEELNAVPPDYELVAMTVFRSTFGGSEGMCNSCQTSPMSQSSPQGT